MTYPFGLSGCQLSISLPIAVGCSLAILKYANRASLYYRMRRAGIDKRFRQKPPPGQLNEVLFTNRRSGCCPDRLQPRCTNQYCKARNENRVIELINAAEHTLSVCMYFFTCKRFGDAVIAAHQRGVRVRVIGDKSMAYAASSQLLRMARLVIPVRFPIDTDRLVHHKFCLIDARPPSSPPSSSSVATAAAAARPEPPAAGDAGGERRIRLPSNGVLLNGSMNWTVQALTGNWENIVITSMPDLLEPFVSEFETMWADFDCNRFVQPVMTTTTTTAEEVLDVEPKAELLGTPLIE